MNSHYSIYTCNVCQEETEVCIYHSIKGRTDCRFEDAIKPECAKAEPSTCENCDSEIPQSFIEDEFE
jgi:hypothetical protein